jgi:uncharacterized RDD family membrane protein YckC
MATSNPRVGVLARRRDAPASVVEAGARPVVAHSSYAGFVTRTIAFAMDAAIINAIAITVAAVVSLVLSIFPVAHNTKTILAAVGGVLFFVWIVAYFVAFWTTTGKTPGSHVMRIRVMRPDGGMPGLARALARFAGLVIGLPLFLGYVPILLNDRRRGLQDVFGGTVVVNLPPDSPSSPKRGTLP